MSLLIVGVVGALTGALIGTTTAAIREKRRREHYQKLYYGGPDPAMRSEQEIRDRLEGERRAIGTYDEWSATGERSRGRTEALEWVLEERE